MTTSTDDVLARIDAVIGCHQCGGPLDGSPSPDFCGEDCQHAWHTARADQPTHPQINGMQVWAAMLDGVADAMRAIAPAVAELSRTVAASAATMRSKLAEPSVREIPVHWITDSMGTMYEARAEIRPRHGAPRLLVLRHAAMQERPVTARLITTLTTQTIELRDERTGHVLARDTASVPPPPRPRDAAGSAGVAAGGPARLVMALPELCVESPEPEGEVEFVAGRHPVLGQALRELRGG